jgi:hypothetical protein
MRVIKLVLGPAFPSGEPHMDAYLSGPADLSYSDEPPVLLTASSRTAMARGQRTIEAARYVSSPSYRWIWR